jgi:PKD repeat protein
MEVMSIEFENSKFKIMKRFLLQIIFLSIMLPSFSQVYVEIQGHIDDSATGNPIPFHEYTIVSDSSSGFIYNYTGQSDPTGFIFHLVPVPAGSSGILYFQTLDCNQILRGDTLTFNPANLDFWVAFDICYADTGCQAYFYTYAYANRIFFFNDESSGYPTNWYWDFGDGTFSTDQDAWHQYNANGWYTVTHTIINTSTGCQSSMSTDVYANDSTPGNCHAIFEVIPDSTNYPPYTYHFLDQSTGSLNTWVWDFGDGTDTTIYFPQSPNIHHTYAQTGNYMVCLNIQGIDTACTDDTCYTLVVGSGIGCLANFTYSSSPNTSTPTQFEDLSQITGGGTITSWGWSFGDPGSGANNFSNLQNPVHLFSSAGSFTVCLTIQGSDSTCSDSICKIIVVGSNAGCTANFTYSSNPNTSTPTQFTDLSISTGGGPITLWSWVFDDPASGSSNTSDLQNPTHLFAAPGYHNVSLFISREDISCTDIIYKTVFVETLVPVYLTLHGNVTNITTGEPGPNHAVTWGILPDTLVGPRTTFSDNNGFYSDSLQLPPGMLSGNLYLWTEYCDNIVLWLSTEFGPNHYDIHWDINETCDSNQMCHAKMKYSAAGPLTVQFEDRSTGFPTSWAWDFGDGNASILEKPVHTYGSPGDYNVTLSITNNATGCTSTTSELIHFADSALCKAGFTYFDTITPRTIQFNDLSSGGSGIYYWEFGDGFKSTLANPLHTYRHPGMYRVFHNISNNDSSCSDAMYRTVMVDYSIPPCDAKFTFTPGSSGSEYAIQFQDQSTGYPENWFWNFGDSTYSVQRNPLHAYPGPGTYNACLIISGNGSTSTFCLDVVIEDSVVYYQVYGQVFEGYFPLQTGTAMIVSLDSNLIYNPFIDVCPIDTNGVYYFTLVPDGNYVVYAIPLDSSGYLPTYFGDAVNWSEATVIPLGEPVNPYEIHLVEAAYMPIGPGSVSGQINLPVMRSSYMDKMVMLLMNETGKIISFDRVSESGSFAFPSLDYGIYYLHAEMSGITSDNVKVILTNAQPHADVVMTFSGKNILGMENDSSPLREISVYPNPANDKVDIALNLKVSTVLNLDIYDLRGQMVSCFVTSSGPGRNVITIPAAQLSAGFYMLRISSDNGIHVVRKLMIAR